MILPKINTSLFDRLRFILVETSHPGNIGACARAIKTMGFGEMVLINPRFADATSNPEAIAFASGAQDILQRARIVGSFAEAVADCGFVAAVTARLREYSPPVLSSRAVANEFCRLAALPAASASTPVPGLALVFGNERYGLPNEIVEKCHALVSIPANPAYSSLNLAQAVQVLAYECRVAAQEDGVEGGASATRVISGTGGIGFQGQPASAAQIDGMFGHLQQALVEIGFLDADNPKKLMPRLKRLFARAGLEEEEVNILRGIARQMMQMRKDGKP